MAEGGFIECLLVVVCWDVQVPSMPLTLLLLCRAVL